MSGQVVGKTYIGVDAGTSMTKAALIGADGAVLAVEAERTRLDRPGDGWVEQDPEDVVQSVALVIRRVIERTGARPSVIGITGQGDGIWLLDDRGRAVRPAISWMDARATPILRRWLADGVAALAFRRTGNAAFPGAPATILAWLDAYEPDSLDRAATAGYCKDAVFTRFTGRRATDPSDASLPFLNPHTRRYDSAVVELYGLTHRANLLAPVEEPTPIGALGAEFAELTGVPAGTPVAAGPFDLAACALGSGLDEPGDGHLTIGTTLACQVLLDDLAPLRLDVAEPAGLTLATVPAPRWLRAMPAMVGTAALDWVLDLAGMPHDLLDAVLAESPPGARGVRCLPFFSPAGERAPFVEPAARARLDGLTLQTARVDLVRATCEAIAYAARHCLEAAQLVGTVAACGGGVGSAAWLQIFADVLGRPVRVARGPEAGARGAVMAALMALGQPVDVETWTTPERVVEPAAAGVEYYETGYARYRAELADARGHWAIDTSER